VKTDKKQNISSIRHFLKKRHWVSDVFARMCLQLFVTATVSCLKKRVLSEKHLTPQTKRTGARPS